MPSFLCKTLSVGISIGFTFSSVTNAKPSDTEEERHHAPLVQQTGTRVFIAVETILLRNATLRSNLTISSVPTAPGFKEMTHKILATQLQTMPAHSIRNKLSMF